MRTTIILARHGETDWNRQRRWQGSTDVELNEVGRSQALALASLARALEVRQVGSSDLRRAWETAQIVARELALGQVQVDEGLRERCFGVFEGLTELECHQRFPEDWASYRSDSRKPPPGAEEQAKVAARVRAAIERAARGFSGVEGSLLLVSHGGAIRTFVLAITGSLPPPLGNGEGFRVEFRSGIFGAVEPVG